MANTTKLLKTHIKTIIAGNDTILEVGGSYTPTGTWTNLTLVTPALGTPTSGTLTNCTTATQTKTNNTTKIASTAYADALVADAIINEEVAIAPSQNAVFDALALKANLISPIFTTPALGTPTSGTLTNCTFPTLNQDTTGKSGAVARTLYALTNLGTTPQILGSYDLGTVSLELVSLYTVTGGRAVFFLLMSFNNDVVTIITTSLANCTCVGAAVSLISGGDNATYTFTRDGNGYLNVATAGTVTGVTNIYITKLGI